MTATQTVVKESVCKGLGQYENPMALSHCLPSVWYIRHGSSGHRRYVVTADQKVEFCSKALMQVVNSRNHLRRKALACS
jgi:hypothetical protein